MFSLRIRTTISNWTLSSYTYKYRSTPLCLLHTHTHTQVHLNILLISVHRIFQARIPEWVAMPFSRGSSWPSDQSQVSRIAGGFFTIWATRVDLDIITHLLKSCKNSVRNPIYSPDSQIIYILHHLSFSLSLWYIFICLYMPACIYIYIYIYIHTHTHIYIFFLNHLKLSCYQGQRAIVPLPQNTFVFSKNKNILLCNQYHDPNQKI